MTPDTPDLTPSPDDAGARQDAPTPASDGAAEAPKRKPRARKTVSADAATGDAGAVEPGAPTTAAEPAIADGEAAAPKPRRRTRKADAAAEGADADAGAPREPAAGEGTRPSAASFESAVPAPARAEAADRADAGEGPGERADAGDRGEGAEGTDAGDAGDGADGEGRRSRNRRRRRRGRGTGEGEGEGEGTAAQAAGGEDEAGGEPGAPRPPRPARMLAPPIEFEKADVTETFAGVLSGQFDVEAEVVEGQPSIPAKRVLAPEPDAPKLHKVLAQSGIGSRRDMEQLIADGKVQVNGETAHTGQRISFGDEVRVAGRVVKLRIAPPPARVLAYHKPAGEIVTMDDPQNRPTVFRRLPRLHHGKWQAVGRLDINTEGLLLLTNSGDLANKLMHPRFGVEREYAVRVLGELGDDQRERLLSGVVIDGQEAAFKSIEDGGGEGVNRWYRVVISEGRNREVRKLFDAAGLTVSRLIRIRYGSVVLPRGLKRGVWVDLDDSDVRRLRHLAGDVSPAPRAEEPAAAPAAGPAGQKARPDRPERADRKDRPNRKDRQREKEKDRPRGDRDRERERDRGTPSVALEPGDPRSIPNPLIQTFDRRAMQQRERPIAYSDDDEDIGPIPNPLQQTYDKRFVKEQRGFGGGKGKHGKGGGGGGQPKQPDPMQTAVGYIGADTFIKKLHGRGGGGGGGRGRR